MKPRSSVLLKLADLYEKSAAGRRGAGKVDVQPDFEELLKSAGCSEGESRELAERELRSLDGRLLQLQYDNPRAKTTVLKVRLSPANEEAFFAHIGRQSPTRQRKDWAALLAEATDWPVPERFADAWRTFCLRRAESAQNWQGMKPFDRADLPAGRELLALIPRLLAWEGRHLVRWASSVICRDSKLLERRQKSLEFLLADATENATPTYESLGILPVPSGVTFHGPLRLKIGTEWEDFSNRLGPVDLSSVDVERITACDCLARRCLTVENKTPFRSLVTHNSGELLIQTSYPNEATLTLLRHLKALPTPPEFWHFGDTDPSGYHILADLRERSGISFRSFHMRYRPSPEGLPLSRRERTLIEDLIPKMSAERSELEAMLASGTKGDFEQESLRPPTHSSWPFYDGID